MTLIFISVSVQLSAVKSQKKKLERQVASLQQHKAQSEDLKEARAEQKRLKEQVESLLTESQRLSRQLAEARRVACMSAAAHDSVCGQLVSEAETNAVLSRSMAVLEEHCHEMDRSHSKAVDSLRAEIQHSTQSSATIHRKEGVGRAATSPAAAAQKDIGGE